MIVPPVSVFKLIITLFYEKFKEKANDFIVEKWLVLLY